MPNAPASSRATDSVTLTVGLVPIALNIFSASDSTAGVNRHEYLPEPVLEPVFEADGVTQKTEAIEQEDGTTENVPVFVQKVNVVTKEDGTTEEVPVFTDHAVGRLYSNKTTAEPLSPEEKARVQSKVETEFGPVYVEDHEVEALFTLTPKTVTVLSFQPQALFTTGEYVPSGLVYVEPVKIKTGKTKGQYDEVSLKLYTTLMEAMRKEGVMAVVEVITRGTPKPAVLMPDGRLWYIKHTDQVRAQRELPDYATDPEEVTFMRTLLKMNYSTEVLDLSDERAALVNEFATNKAKAGDFGKPEEPADAPAQAPSSVDLSALLRASIEAAKAS